MAYNTGFAPTLLSAPAPLPVFYPASSIPFSFASPPNPSTSTASSAGPSSASSSRHASLQARRPPRGPPPPAPSTARRPRASLLSMAGAVQRRDGVDGAAASGTGPTSHRDRLRHEHEGGLERLLEGRAPLGVDLAAEKRDLSEEEQEEEFRNHVIQDFGRTFLVPIGILRTQEELDAVQTRTPSPTPPSNAEDNRPFQHNHAGGGHGRHQQQYRERSAEVSDVDQMRDLDDDLDDEDGESGDDEEDDLEAEEEEYDEYEGEE